MEQNKRGGAQQAEQPARPPTAASAVELRAEGGFPRPKGHPGECRTGQKGAETTPGRRRGLLQWSPAGLQAPPVFPLFPSFLPPSYTHRPHCELARAPGGSGPDGGFPPKQNVWQIPKIDCRHTNCTCASHHDPGHGHARSHGWGAAGCPAEALGAREGAYADLL